jgi:hypothetical protein
MHCEMNYLLLAVLVVAVVLFVVYSPKEKFGSCKHYSPGDKSHCPKWCDPFQYPNMYSPQPSCGDPMNWGFTYSTGRCPHAFK